MNNLNEYFKQKKQISPYLLSLLYEPILISKDNYYKEIVTILLFLDIVSKLGWIEHTSDWDIGAIIKTRTILDIEILQGYADCLTLHDDNNIEIINYNYYQNNKTKNFTLQLTKEDCDTDDDMQPFSIKISDIFSIEIFN